MNKNLNYCSYETCMLLKQKGFNELCDDFYCDAYLHKGEYVNPDHLEELWDFVGYVFENENNLLNYLFGDTLIYTSNDNMDTDDKPEIRNGDYEEIYKGN